MGLYHGQPNRAEPNAWAWYGVETPCVFREYKLPVRNDVMTCAHKRQYAELRRLAEQHGTHIRESSYRRRP